jgi:hypothetical protein
VGKPNNNHYKKTIFRSEALQNYTKKEEQYIYSLHPPKALPFFWIVITFLLAATIIIWSHNLQEYILIPINSITPVKIGNSTGNKAFLINIQLNSDQATKLNPYGSVSLLNQSGDVLADCIIDNVCKTITECQLSGKTINKDRSFTLDYHGNLDSAIPINTNISISCNNPINDESYDVNSYMVRLETKPFQVLSILTSNN